MRRRIACFLLSLIVFASCCGIAFADNRETTVYITRTGKCYHTGFCSSLRQSKIEVTLEYAVSKGYSRCDKCHPPVPDFEVDATPMPRSSSGSGRGSSSNYTYTPEPEELVLIEENKSEKTINSILSLCMLLTLIVLVTSLCLSSAFPDSHESLVETSWCIFVFLIIIDILLFLIRLIEKS